MRIIHSLKIEQNYLYRLLKNEKKSEIRLNDRDYQLGDVLRFKNWDNKKHDFLITHIHSGLGLEKGYVVLSLEKMQRFTIKEGEIMGCKNCTCGSESMKCIWSYQGDGVYQTCQDEFWFSEGDLKENPGIKYCPYCGKEIKEDRSSYE